MNTSALQRGDSIRCDVRGQKFEAVYLWPMSNGKHAISPQTRNVSHFHVTARQIECKVEGRVEA